ncbi:class I SAM-dependent methyltransferase [Plantactinospora sp. B6F1]|uniref:class I SAM-dependent methyltransferase n=1 Tax=Plantactinospora sp. B6F1 TaxID=3158971 RepID=UPI00102CD78A
MDSGVAATAYLVNESRARLPDLAGDPTAMHWIPEPERPTVRGLWDEYAEAVYPYDDLVVSLRGRLIRDTLARRLERDPATVLVVCGAGFSAYPWLLPVSAALEVDLPEMVAAKRRRAGELTAAGLLDERDVTHLGVDLDDPDARRDLLTYARDWAAGRPVAYVAEGLVFYLSERSAREVIGLGRALGAGLDLVSYWPADTADNAVLAAQRAWFRTRNVPDDASYLTMGEISGILGRPVTNHSPEDVQRRYLGEVRVPEAKLVPEHVAVAGA